MSIEDALHELERLMPDEDQREVAVMRLVQRVYADVAVYNTYNPERKAAVRKACDVDQITDHERWVLAGLASGMSCVDLSEILGCSHDSVWKAVGRAKRKLGGRTRAHTIALAFRNGIIF